MCYGLVLYTHGLYDIIIGAVHFLLDSRDDMHTADINGLVGSKDTNAVVQRNTAWTRNTWYVQCVYLPLSIVMSSVLFFYCFFPGFLV